MCCGRDQLLTCILKESHRAEQRHIARMIRPLNGASSFYYTSRVLILHKLLLGESNYREWREVDLSYDFFLLAPVQIPLETQNSMMYNPPSGNHERYAVAQTPLYQQKA